MYPTPDDLRSGFVIHRQLKALEDFRVESKVISPVPYTPFPLPLIKKKWKTFASIPFYQNIEGIEVFHTRFVALYPQSLLYTQAGVRMWNGMKKKIEQIKIKGFDFDLIHAHYGFPDGGAALEVGRIYQKPVVTTFQATDIDKNIYINSNSSDTITAVLKNASYVISPSPRLQKKVKEKLDVSSRFLGYGIETANIFKGTSELRKSYPNKTLILSVCRLIRSKGLDLNILALAELIKKYPHLHYLVLGDGPDKERLMNLTKEHRLESHITFLGEQSNKKAMEYISICDIFSLPSWQETFGQVYIEAMAHNKPVIAVKGQGVDGIIEDKVNGFLASPKDVRSIIDSIDYILSNTAEIEKLTSGLNAFVEEHFSWKRIAEETFKIYKEVLDNLKS